MSNRYRSLFSFNEKRYKQEEKRIQREWDRDSTKPLVHEAAIKGSDAVKTELSQKDLEETILDKIHDWLLTGYAHGYISNQIYKQLGIKDYKYGNVVWIQNKYTGKAGFRSTTIDELIEDTEKSLSSMLYKAAPREKKGETNHGRESKPGEQDKPIFNYGDILYTKKRPVTIKIKEGHNVVDRECYTLEMYFRPGSLERPSLTGRKKDRLLNIVHLYQRGIRRRKETHVYGYWGDALKDHSQFTNSKGYVRHLMIQRDANGNEVGRIHPKGEDPRIHVYNRRWENSRRTKFDFMERVVHEFNVLNGNRVGVYAKMTGKYVLKDSVELTWQQIMGTYKKSYGKKMDDNEKAERKAANILYLSRKANHK